MAGMRSIRSRGRRRKKGSPDVDITSLLDIVTILLVFLIQSYDSSGIVVNVPPGIELPKAINGKINSAGVIVQVSPTKVWVEDQLIIDIEGAKKSNIKMYDDNEQKIVPLYDELVRLKEQSQMLEKTVTGAKPFSGVINLVVDKTIKYSYVKKVMYTAAAAGYQQYKFVVEGLE